MLVCDHRIGRWRRSKRQSRRLVGKDELIAAVWPGVGCDRQSGLVASATCGRLLVIRIRKSSEPRRGVATFLAAPVARASPTTDRETASNPWPHPRQAINCGAALRRSSGVPEQDQFAEGMVAEIITALSRISWLFVIAQLEFPLQGPRLRYCTNWTRLGVRRRRRFCASIGGTGTNRRPVD